MGFNEKISYLKGLADGVKLDDHSEMGRLIRTMIEAMDELATAVSALEETVSTLGSELDELSEDLSGVEDVLYGEEEEDVAYGVKCPTCGEEISLDEQMIRQGGLKCPQCGEDIELEFGCDCDGCGDARIPGADED